VSDSGPNLAVRGAGFLLVLAGLFLISTGYRIGRSTSRFRGRPAMTIYGVGAFAVAGGAAVVLGAVLLGLVS
jgi:hypothetical protein